MTTEEDRRNAKNARRRARYHESRNETFIERNIDCLSAYPPEDRELLRKADFILRRVKGLDAAIAHCAIDNVFDGQPMSGWRDDLGRLVEKHSHMFAS